MTHQYQILGMTCGSCAARVKNELLKLGDVEQADIQLQSPQATITMSKHIGTTALQQAISKAGNFFIEETGNHKQEMEMEAGAEETGKTSYLPIILIFGYITGVSVLIQVIKGSFSWIQWMGHFMAGFFLVFSFFKLMNLRGFAEGYRTYDIVAKRFPVWGFIYPFAELGLALAFIIAPESLGTNLVTFIVMGVSCIGVIQSLIRKKPFVCACLGTVIKLPLSKVTLAEDLIMVAMSGTMLALMLLNILI
jgi:copper chaperone CopZ